MTAVSGLLADINYYRYAETNCVLYCITEYLSYKVSFLIGYKYMAIQHFSHTYFTHWLLNQVPAVFTSSSVTVII